MKNFLIFFLLIVLIYFTATTAQNPTKQRTQTPVPGPSTGKPIRKKQECTKQPPNFREINLPCGGYDRQGCQNLCQQLEYPKFYCRATADFCLCHSGDLYSC